MHTVNLRVLRPLSDFLHRQAGAALLLVAAAVVAMIWANSPWSDSYVDLWETEAAIGVGDFELHLTLRQWINDGAMAFFFLVVGLEIKRELTEGELRNPRQAALPIIGAFGGMIVPALIFTLLNLGGPGQDGWGIPMATDIAIVLGVVALLGNRAPSWLKLFLLALAIVDDIGAILVIAIFYSEGVSFGWLGLAVAALATAVLIRPMMTWMGAYIALGCLCWISLHEAHIHPTLAGVAFGMIAPITPHRSSEVIDADQLARNPTVDNAVRVYRQVRSSVSTVEWLEHRLHKYSAFLVVPLFALANAGISVPAAELADAFSSEVTWGVILGLLVGKTIGISAFTLIAVAVGIGKLPVGVTPRYVVGAGALGGIGFTVSLLVAELAYGEAAVGTDARLGVLVASLAAALIGAGIMIPGRVLDDRSMDEHTKDQMELSDLAAASGDPTAV